MAILNVYINLLFRCYKDSVTLYKQRISFNRAYFQTKKKPKGSIKKFKKEMSNLR